MDLFARLQVFGAEVARNTAVSLPFPWPPHNLVVAVSGGPDSLALLHALRRLVGPERLAAAHVNHGLRPEAAAEAQFVADTAVSWQIPYYATALDVAALAMQEGVSVEEAGRQARYRFFAQVAAQVGASVVATGHHADDQAETVLMHLLRGSGLAGLRGMEPATPMPFAPEVTLIRPFLTISRAEIEAYCREHQLQPREDSSNREATFFRNRLRLHLLPLLADYNPQIKRHLQQLGQLVAADEALLAQFTMEAWQSILQEQQPDWLAIDRAQWLALPLSLRRRTLRHAVGVLSPGQQDVAFPPVEQARLLIERGRGGDQTWLPGGIWLVVDYGRFLLATTPDAIPVRLPQLPGDAPLPLPLPGRVGLANGWVVETAVLPTPDLTIIQQNPDPWLAYVPHHCQPLFLRPRQPGERFQPLGLQGRSTRLKELMIDGKIPAGLRRRWPLVVTGDHPVWLVGYRLDERARVTSAAAPVVQIRCYWPGDHEIS